MTRFARAKGSKASNERKEEEPTPWHIMRQQLAEQLIKNNSVHAHKSSVTEDIIGKSTTDESSHEMWFEFDELKSKKPCVKSDIKDKKIDKILKIPFTKEENNTVCDIVGNKISLDAINKSVKKSSSKAPIKHKPDTNEKKKLKELKSLSLKSMNEILQSSPHRKDCTIKESKQNSNSEGNCVLQTEKKSVQYEGNSKEFNNFGCMNNSTIIKKKSEVQSLEDTIPEKAQPTFTHQESFNFHNIQKMKSYELPFHTSKGETKNRLTHKNQTSKRVLKREFEGHLGTKMCGAAQTIFANGREIKIVKFEAFWIKKEDANKLRELKKKLKGQNVPSDKIKTIIKLERRKAEKALSREKTNVCYQCRKFGHKLSECPEINDLSVSKAGICFKCGSTEHTHFECKVTHNQSFRYAVCFICNEQGHIARQCLLNPQGQYPKGGSCHLCGEVTHLRKDCPKAHEEKLSNFATIGNITNGMGLEDVREVTRHISDKKMKVIRSKTVQF